MAENQEHRVFCDRTLRRIVWIARVTGWMLIALAILNVPQIGILTHVANSLRLLGSIVLGILGIAWVVGLQLFLRLFDQYLSQN